MSIRTVLVAGCAGGVGTTTVAALLFSAWGDDYAPRLADRSGGTLGARLTSGDEVRSLDEELVVADLGAHAAGELLERMTEPDVFAVVVGLDTPAGRDAVRAALVAVRDRHGVNGSVRTVAVLTGTAGRGSARPWRRGPGREVEQLRNEFGQNRVVVLPRDRALAAGGRIPLTRVATSTKRARREILGAVRGMLAAFTRTTGVGQAE